MLEGSCSCGSAGWSLTGDPGPVTACNCTLCRRYGALWAYDFEDERIRVRGPTLAFVRADIPSPRLEILACPTCAAVLAWRGLTTDASGRRRMAVNVRLAEPDAVGELELVRYDGLVTLRDLPPDGRRVRDIWF